ncbi:HisA/HisF-related TIM barrel protein [Phyllobacterium sp. 21LDTY02-6]|uniref:HisA/HisF-related TIM barrel protein n=1 Tax=Phyllobacterium sp. 21LDTY02-6 TaxID=2944903 RepID=UPI002021EAD6|nr:HisA/HisF-related TIM barrel protein [Phyllobacterium sp. 21LDTY02-6]
MHIIPVLDIKDGLVVAALRGDRDNYRPIATPLSRSADPMDVARGLRQLYPFPAYYVADLDAIQHGRQNWTIDLLEPLLEMVDVFIDAGFARSSEFEAALAADRLWPVLGSESQENASVLEQLHREPRLVLSLDFRGDEFLGPPAILDDAERWPARVIVMTLGRIGAGGGPDFDRLDTVKQRAGSRKIIAAGGIRGPADLERLEAMGIDAALVSTSLHNGSLSAEIIRSFMSGNVSMG